MTRQSNAAALDRNFDDGGWTEERIERLRGMWASRLTCGEIATALGGLTRNAVIGKARRLGLAPRQRGRPGRADPRSPRRARAARLVRTGISRLLASSPRPPDLAPAGVRGEAAAPLGYGLLQLTPSTCRWPIGEPGTADFYFCGARSLARRPYCPAHWRIAYPAWEAAESKRVMPASPPGVRRRVDFHGDDEVEDGTRRRRGTNDV